MTRKRQSIQNATLLDVLRTANLTIEVQAFQHIQDVLLARLVAAVGFGSGMLITVTALRASRLLIIGRA